MTIQISIIGLGKIGASIGLALSPHTGQLSRTGNDIQPKVMQAAQKQGAVDRIEYNLPACVEKADIILLALPIDQT